MTEPQKRLTVLVAESRPVVEAELQRRRLHPAYLEVAHIPTGDHRWDHLELRTTAERSVVRRTGWPIGVVLHRDEARPQALQTGIFAMIYSEIFQRSLDYWRLDRDGAYYFVRTFGEDNHEGTPPGTVLAFDTRIWRIAETFEHARVLYQNLGVNPTEKIQFLVRHSGLAGRTLVASEPGRYIRPIPRQSSAPEVVWTGEATLDQINTDLRGLVQGVCNELFLMFDFFQLADTVLDDLLSKYLSSRI